MTAFYCLVMFVVTFLFGAGITLRGIIARRASKTIAHAEVRTSLLTVLLKDTPVGVAIIFISVLPMIAYVMCRDESETVTRRERTSALGFVREVEEKRAVRRGDELQDISANRVKTLLAQASDLASKQRYAEAEKPLQTVFDELLPAIKTAALTANNLAECKRRSGSLSLATAYANIALLLDDSNPEFERTLHEIRKEASGK